MNYLHLCLVSFVLVSLGSRTAKATTIYNNGAPDQSNAANISGLIVADDFILEAPATITGVTFWASSDVDPFTSQFSGVVGWGLFDDAAGTPGQLLSSGVNNSPTLTDTGIQILGTEEYRIDFAVPSIVLASGTYWLGLHEGAFGAPDDGTTIYWDTTSAQSGSVSQVTYDLSGSGGWFQGLPDPGSDLAFELTGSFGGGADVPEPMMCLPMLLVCVAFVLSRITHR